jgi:uncharacterized RDD family membrane protein YckC
MTMTSDTDRGIGVAYAGFGRRVGAYLIDTLLAIVFGGLLGFAAALAEPALLADDDLRFDLAMMALVFLVTVLMESSGLQGTPGKLALGLKVTDLTGQRIGFWRAALRYVAEVLNSLTLGVGYLMAAFTDRRQALHDIVAGTLIVHRDAEATRIAAAGPGNPLSGWAITGLALLAMLPTAAIIAAIVVPAYDEYQVRAQVIEGLTLASIHKTAVAEAWLTSPLEFDEIHTATVGDGLPISGRYVASIEIDTGAVVIEFGGEAAAVLQGRVLTLVPAVDEHLAIGWACGYGSPPEGFAAIFEDSGQFTDVPDEYLPGICRHGDAGDPLDDALQAPDAIRI